MQSKCLVLAVCVSMVAVTLVGCRPKRPKPDAAAAAAPDVDMVALQEVPPSSLHDLYVAVDAKLAAGDTAGATQDMLAALEAPAHAAHKAELYTTLTRFLLHTEQVAEAKTRFLNLIRTEPELARPGFDLIYGYYVQRGDAAATLAWVRQLLLQPLTPPMKRPVMEWLLVGLLETDAVEELGERLSAFLEEFPAEDGAQVVQRLSTTALQTQRHAAIERMLAAVLSSTKREEPALVQVATVSRMLALLGRSDWDAVAVALPGAVATLPDVPLQTVVANLVSATRRAQAPARLDTLAEMVLRSVDVEKTGARNLAAREWINAAVEQGHLAAVPDRIAALLAMQLPPRQVYLSLSRHFYAMLEHPEVLRPLLTQAEALSPLLDEDRSRNALRALMLDGRFITKDYDRALALLAEGIPDRDADWHAMATAKVQAHKAMLAKDTDAAVRHFREFMEIVARSEEERPDPVTNVVHTRDTILGRNAKRIGDLYREAGRADEARAAYAEARAHYAKALAENQAGEATATLIRQELAAVPQ